MNLISRITGIVMTAGRAAVVMFTAVVLVACGGSSDGDAADSLGGGSKAKGAMTIVEFQVELCLADGTCEGLYEDTDIDLLVNGEPWSGDRVATADSPLGPYRAIIEVPKDAILTVAPVGAGPGTVGETKEIAVGDIPTGTCSDMSKCPVLLVTLQEQ